MFKMSIVNVQKLKVEFQIEIYVSSSLESKKEKLFKRSVSMCAVVIF